MGVFHGGLLLPDYRVLYSNFKSQDYILPGTLPPGCDGKPRSLQRTTESLVLKAQGTVVYEEVPVQTVQGEVLVKVPRITPWYEFMGRRLTLADVSALLANAAPAQREVQVQVSYERETPWDAVGQIINECARFKLPTCSLVHLHE